MPHFPEGGRTGGKAGSVHTGRRRSIEINGNVNEAGSAGGGCVRGGRSAANSGATLTVSAAISLEDAFTQLGQAYEAAHPGVSVQFNFGASGDLEQQIAAGAPVDVFASASAKETSELAQKGKIIKDTLVSPLEKRSYLSPRQNPGTGPAPLLTWRRSGSSGSR